jgi:hypothetical protein
MKYPALNGIDLTVKKGRIPGHHGPVRLWQDDAFERHLHD